MGPRIRLRFLCACCDPSCPTPSNHAQGGGCGLPATAILYRVNMEDHTGTDMCGACAIDAIESGVFSLYPEDMSFWSMDRVAPKHTKENHHA